MPTSSNYYPSITSLIPDGLLPEQLAFIQEGLEKILKELYYKDLQIQRSSYGEASWANLSLVSYTRLGFEFPGTNGLALVLNPAIDSQDYTEFPVSFGFRLEILKYIRSFNFANFLDDPKGIFDLLIEFLQLDDIGILHGAIESFFTEEDTSFSDYVSLYNSKRSPAITLDESVGNSTEIVKDLVEKISDNHSLILTVFEDFILANSLSDSFENIKRLVTAWLGEFDLDDLKKLIIPQLSASLNSLTVALEFPRTIFKPLDGAGEVIDADPAIPEEDKLKTRLTFDVGRLSYSTNRGFIFDEVSTFNFHKSQIFNSGFTLELNDVKLDLSRETNIAEATADGRPVDFIGAYITSGTIGFPAFWNHDDSNSTGQITARNLLVGTGGISGTLGLEAKTAGNPAPLIKAKFGSGFEVSLDAFDITFQQNAIIGSNIHGTMRIPNFEDAAGNPAEIQIDVHIGQDGDFSVTARESDGIEICIPNVLKFILKSASIGREDDRFFLSISGALSFDHGTSVMSSIIPKAIEFQEIIIWDDGQFEIKGGSLELPQALTLSYPPVDLAVTAIHLGSIERDYDDGGTTVLRKYKYFGFDGTVKVDPGGVEAKGKGIQVYFSSDNSVYPLDMFIRIESIALDLIFPGDVDPKDAALLISGFLSMKEPPPGIPGTEYAGGISFDLPKAGIGGAAAMRFNPKVPYFIVDAEVEMSKAIPLGSTGLGIYGFRGLIGKHFVATKNAAGVADTEPWWKYYKAKVDPDYKEGVQISKFDPIGGFALGLGVSLATSTDGGKVFSSKIFLLLSLRELLMLQGQAAILSERIKLNDPNDPPFFALLVITKDSIEAALGVNYLVPDNKRPGSIATVQGVLEIGFFFKDSSAWYLNIGRDLPESYRIQVRLLELFDAYFYFMLSAKGIRAGAGASFNLEKKFGPLYARLYAYLDIAGKIAFKPKQIGGSIQLGGGVELSIFGLGFGVSAAASLAAESPEPFIVTGGLKVCIKVLKKDRCAKFEFTWLKNETVDTTEIGVIDRTDIGGAAQAINIQTKNAFALNFVKESSGLVYRGASDPPSWLPPSANPSDPDYAHWNSSFDDHIIPLDCFIDIEFKNGLNPNGGSSTDNFGKNGGGANHIQYVAPQKGKTPRVKHSFQAEEIFIYAWNPDTNAWEEYNIYDSMTPMDDLDFIDPVAIDALNLKSGHWQLEEKNKYNKLRVLAQTPLSYMTGASGEFIPENSGITSETIFCEESAREKCCVSFEHFPIHPAAVEPVISPITWNQLYFFEKFSFKLIGRENDSVVQTVGTHLGNNAAIKIGKEQVLEVTFLEPTACIDFVMSTTALSVTVEYYQFVISPTAADPLHIEEQKLTYEDVFTAAELASGQQYLDGDNLVDKIKIIPNDCPRQQEGHELNCDGEITAEGEQLEIFFDTLAKKGHLTQSSFKIYPDKERDYDGAFLNTVLYNSPLGPRSVVTYNVINQTTAQLIFRVTDNNEYSCQFELNAPKAIDWNRVISFSNLRPDPSRISEGENFDFLIDVYIQGRRAPFVFQGSTTCFNILNCESSCETYLYKLCVLSGEDYFYNLTIPGSGEVTAETDSMVDALEKTFQPIWRPNTKFAIAIKTNEAVSGGGSANHRNTFYYGFQTKGPVGHFHNYLDESNTETIREDYQSLIDVGQEDAYQLSTLKHYIDYRRSYPNADGDLLNAKPLFYKDPRLLLFYKKQYVYAMFGNWDVYAGNNTVNGALQVVIEDPVPPVVPPEATPLWALDAFAIKGADVIALNNMIENSAVGDCPPDDEITPNGVNSVIDINELKPLKLYTAIFNNSYQRDVENGTPTTVREVHRYPFRTSRYGTFKEQVLSYQLLVDETDPLIVLKEAVFDLSKPISDPDITIAQGILGGSNDLILDYADLFERILQGALKLGTLQPAVTNEFNKVYTESNRLLGIWIRCPEPFNDPKLPESELETTIRLSVDGDGEANYKALFSKDKREVFVTNTDDSMEMSSGDYLFTFDYKEWNGNAYVVVHSKSVTITI